MNRGQAFRLLIKDGITIGLFYLICRIFWGKESWFHDKTQELLSFLLIGIIFFLLSIGVNLIKRPILISLIQKNAHYGKNETNFSISGRKKTQEHERMVSLSVTVTKQGSFWHWIIGKILKKMNLSIVVEPVTKGIVLQAEDEALRNDITPTSYGFEIDLGNYIERIITRSNLGTHDKGCDYVVTEDRNNKVSEETIHITPVLYANGKTAPFWLEFLVNFECPEHIVNFRWE